MGVCLREMVKARGRPGWEKGLSAIDGDAQVRCGGGRKSRKSQRVDREAFG